MRSTVPILAFLVLLHLTVSQFSYIPGRAFNSYQIKITNTAAPGTDLTASDNGTLFALPLNEVHDNVNHFAVAFAGYSNPSASVQVSFELIVVSNTSTQYVFSLGVYGGSAIRQLNFVLILIGNEGFGAIEAVTVSHFLNLYRATGQIGSSTFTYITSVPAPNRFLILLSGFKAQQQGGLNKFFVRNFAITPVGQVVTYLYYSGYGTRLTWAKTILLLYNSTSPAMATPYFVYYNAWITSLSQLINLIQTAFPGKSYLQGNNQKCMLSLKYVNSTLNTQIMFDLNYPAPQSYYYFALCYLEYYDCSLIDPQCLQCQTRSICTSCKLGYSVQTNSNTSSTCTLCSTTMPNCLACSPSAGTPECLLCQQGYQAVTGGCTRTVGCAQIDILSRTCLSCLPSFQGLSNNTCQCRGRVANDICTTDSGCVVPYFDGDGSVVCSFCDVTLLFAPFPVNKKCVCKERFHTVIDQCQEVCGDGFNMGEVECDDGNTINGDGCSSKCSAEVGYRCSKGNDFAPSVCTYVGTPLNLTLTSIKRDGNLNQGLFSFAVYPPLLNIKKMNLSSYVKLDCTINETVSDIVYDHNGELTLTVSFTTDLEGMPCSVNLIFDTTIIESPNITLTFNAVSETQPLRIVQNQEQLKTTNTIFWAISYIATGIFFLSLSHKIIGAELITNLQIVCISNAFYHKSYFFFNEVRRLELVTGFWSMFHEESDSDFSPPFSQRVDLTPFFLENSLIVVAVLIPATVAFLILKCYIHTKTVTGAEQPNRLDENPPTELKRLGCIVRALYRMLLFPLSAGFMLVLSLSCNIQALRFTNTRTPTFPIILNSVSKLVFLILIGVFSSEIIYKKDQSIGLNEAKSRYIPLFMLRSTLISTLMFLGVRLGYNTLIYWILGIQGLYFLIVTFGRPYKMKCGKFDNIGVILLQATTLYAVGLPLAMRFTEVSELYEYFLVLMLQGMILVAMALSLIRLLIHYLKIVRGCLSPEVKVNEVNETEVGNEENLRQRNNKQKRHTKRANKPDALRDMDEIAKQLLKANPYSLNQNLSKGIRVVDSQNQTKSRTVNRDKAPKRKLEFEKVGGQRELQLIREERDEGMVGGERTRMIREEKEEKVEDPELAACKHRLRESFLKKQRRDKTK